MLLRRTDGSQYKKKPRYPYILRFEGGGSFTPTERLDDRIQDKLASAGEADYTYCFVMVSDGTTAENRNVLAEHGVKLLGYQFYHSHKAKIPLNRIEEIGNLSFVRWIGYAPFDLKIHPILQKKISSGSDDEIRVYIDVFDSDINEKSEKIVCNDGKTYCKCIPHGPFQNKLEEMGVTILDYEEGRGRVMFTAHATPETINRIAGLDFVLFIKTGDPDANLPLITTLSNQRSPNIDEPLEPEEMTTGDSNREIVTIVQMAFAYIQRRLI